MKTSIYMIALGSTLAPGAVLADERDIASSQDAAVSVHLANGSVGPNTPARATVFVSLEAAPAEWVEVAARSAGTDNGAAGNWLIELPACALNVRVEFAGAKGAAVSCGAVLATR